MAPAKHPELLEALENLRVALVRYQESDEPEPFRFAALSKSFEVAVEYMWKTLKRHVQSEGLDAPSPKEAIRAAARLGVVDRPQDWLDFINARNAAVHAYFTVPKDTFRKVAEECLTQAEQIIQRLDVQVSEGG